MAKAKIGGSRKDTKFGRDLIAAAREALAHKRRGIELPVRVIEPMTRPGEGDPQEGRKESKRI